MASVTITALIGAFDSDDFLIPRNNAGDAGKAINSAMDYIANLALPNGRLYLRPGTYRIVTPVAHHPNIEVMGAGPSTLIKLGPSAYVDVWTATSVSNIRLSNLQIDGNSTNNTAGTRNGLWLEGCTDVVIEDVTIVNARADGIWANNCVRPILVRVSAHDNGRNGICISYCQNSQLVDARSYDNCRVSSSGTADGIRFELLASDNSLTNPHCYETALAGQLHGYGVREAPGEGVYRTTVLGGSQEGNKLGGVSLESKNSIALSTGLISINY